MERSASRIFYGVGSQGNTLGHCPLSRHLKGEKEKRRKETKPLNHCTGAIRTRTYELSTLGTKGTLACLLTSVTNPEMIVLIAPLPEHQGKSAAGKTIQRRPEYEKVDLHINGVKAFKTCDGVQNKLKHKWFTAGYLNLSGAFSSKQLHLHIVLIRYRKAS